MFSDSSQVHALDKVFVGHVVLDLVAELVGGVEGVGEAKVGDDDVLVPVEEEVLEFQVAVDDALLVQVADAGHELGEEPTRGRVLQVAVV